MLTRRCVKKKSASRLWSNVPEHPRARPEMSAGSALVRAVFGDSDDSDGDDADDRASSGRAAGSSPSGGTAAWDARVGDPPEDFIAHGWRRWAPADIPGLVLARGALTPAAQTWLSRAIRADDLMDLPPLDHPPAVPVESAKDADTAPSPRPDPSEGSPSRRRNQAMRFGNFPPWARVLAARVRALAETAAPPCFPPAVLARGDRLFDQMICNSYLPGEGLKPHVDLAAFADGVAVVSLESSAVMDMHPPPTPGIEPVTSASIAARLDPGDVLFLAEDARWLWRHGIAERPWDPIGERGTRRPRGHRTSVTLRAMRDEAHELRVAA